MDLFALYRYFLSLGYRHTLGASQRLLFPSSPVGARLGSLESPSVTGNIAPLSSPPFLLCLHQSSLAPLMCL